MARFDQSEKSRLGKLMRPRQITLCQDETFHPQPCLVAIEPTSQFVLIESLALSEATEAAILEGLIPARYLELVAEKAEGAARRKDLRYRAAKVLGSVDEQTLLLGDVDEQVIEQCAQLFQRSQSCVEGRNSHLDLFHHGHHRLGDRQLKAKTVVHNYLKRRPDGSTAAERFFGEKPHDLFEWLLERLEPPPWPSKPRRRFLN